ncbi:NHL repeat family protein [Lysobacter gummosus]|nr:NHL repeat family protein [Lysobacter gummosus]
MMRTLGLLIIGAICAAFSAASQGAIITSVAGGGSGGSYATRQSLFQPKAIAITPNGDMYVAEYSQIRKITPDGVATIIAGASYLGYGGDGGPAVDAVLNQPSAIAVDPAGNIYIADTYNHRIRKIDTSGIIRTIAGTGVAAASDDGVATATSLNYPGGVAFGGPKNTLYIADTQNHRIRLLDTDGRLVTVAGDGVAGFSGEGVPAEQARVSAPTGLATDVANLYIADTGNERVRQIDFVGRIRTLAGGGSSDTTTDALTARLREPRALAIEPGTPFLFVAEAGSSVVRQISGGWIRPFAGVANSPGYAGDGGDATLATFNRPAGVALDSDGNIYVADTGNQRVRKVALRSAGLPRVGGSKFLGYSVIPVPATVTQRYARLAVGDVTGDGLDDVVVATGRESGSDPQTLKVMLFSGLAGGGLAAPQTAYYASEGSVVVPNIVLADMNNDDILDILIGERTGLSIFPGNGNGALSGTHYSLPIPGGVAGALAVMDVNNDSTPDVVHYLDDLGDQVARDLQVFLGSGGGRLAAPYAVNSALAGGSNIRAGDVNGDGFKDLVVTTKYAQIYVYEHDGINNFRPERSAGVGGNIALGDFDHDGRTDILSAIYGNGSSTMVVRYSADGRSEMSSIPEVALDLNAGDFNGDRRDDLLLTRYDELVAYRQTPLGLSDEVAYSAPGAIGVARGEISGDGCRDAVVLSSQGLLLFPGRNCVEGTLNDLNGDGKSDLVWRDDSREHLVTWRMDGATRVEGMSRLVSPEWRVLATGDFQGDHKLDLIWTDGMQMQLWEGDGKGGFTGVQMRSYPVGYRVVAVGDVNGDGNTDLLWRGDDNTAVGLWVMKGAQIIDSASYSVKKTWWVAGSADMTGDGRMDVVWTDGTFMSLAQADEGLTFKFVEMPGYPQGWELAAVGDINGDGKGDLMWRYPDEGYLVTWAMDGATRLSGRTYQPGAAWRIVQTGDLTGDGRTDVIWTDGHQMQLWQSQGDGFVGVPMLDYPVGWSTVRR